MEAEKVLIRSLLPEDIPAIASIYNHYITNTTITFEEQEVTAEQMAQRAVSISPKYPYLVAVSGNKLVGYAYAHLWKEKSAYSTTLETTVYLSPSNLHAGTGTALMQELIKQCKQKGIHSLIACITADNELSCKFHEKLGFKQVSRFNEVGHKFGQLLDIIDYQIII